MWKKKVKYIINKILIELCCGYCIYKNIHQNHKVLEISDEEKLKKENLSIEELMKESDKNILKINELKKRTENEINEINIAFDTTLNDLKQSFKQKYDKLAKEENELKEKLQNEVTKVKEKLEKFLDNINIELKINKKIKDGIQKFEKEEKNMIKILTYLSKMNKNNINMNLLFQEMTTSLKFSFQEKESNIQFEEYYFNGAPIPYNIEYKDNTFIDYNNLDISWEIENIKNIDKNAMKFKIELKKENEEFEKVYEGEKDNYIINNLKNNTNYEIRICSIYNNVNGLWSEIKKIKTNSIDSQILFNEPKKNEFLKKIYEWTGYKNMELIFRGSRDGMYSKNFHEKCDNQSPTITLFRNDKGNIFGGYLPIPWKSEGGYQNVNTAFIFTLTNIYNIQPTKFASKNNGQEVYFNTGNGPCFYDTWNYEDFVNRSEAYFGSYYQDTTGKGNSMFTGNTDNNNIKITLNEIEVFKLYK